MIAGRDGYRATALRSRSDRAFGDAERLRAEADELEVEANEYYAQAKDAEQDDADADRDWAELRAAHWDRRQMPLFGLQALRKVDA